MRLGILYATVLLGSLVAWALIQYGWKPPFILWDGRSFVYFGMLCFLLGFAATAGLGLLMPTDRLPSYLRRVPGSTAIFVTSMGFMGITWLSSDSTPLEALRAIAIAVAGGVVGGATIGLIAGIWPDKDAEGISIDDQRRRILIALPVIACGGLALLLFPRSRDDAHFQMYSRYGAEPSILEIGLSTGPLDEKRAIIRVSGHGATSALAFDHEDWPAASNLIALAENNIPTSTWRLAGEAYDTAAPASTLQLSSGPGMRIGIRSPHHPMVEHILSTSDIERFNADVARITRDLERD